MKKLSKFAVAAAVFGGVALSAGVAHAADPAAAPAAKYTDTGAPWYYLNFVTSTCDPMPAYGSTPEKYKAWLQASHGDTADFKVMVTDKRGTWLSFDAVWAKGTEEPVMVVQPQSFCQAVLNSQTKQGFMPVAPGDTPPPAVTAPKS